MTLVQVSIADKGNSLVLIADRLLTATLGSDFPSYELEGNEPKLVAQGLSAVGYAGTAIYADMAKREISGHRSLLQIIDRTCSFVKKKREEMTNGQVKRLTGISKKSFFTSYHQQIPQDVAELVYGWHADFNLDFGCIVAGFEDDSKAAKIVHVLSDGETLDVTNFKYSAIGSGSPFSQIFFDMESYDTNVTTEEGIYFAYRAKKWAEAPTGVGSRTDIVLLRRDRSPILWRNESEFIQQLRRIHVDEKKESIDRRRKLVSRIHIDRDGAC